MGSLATVILLTGGTSKRFGTDKSQTELFGITLLNHVLNSLPAECEILLVGDEPINPSRNVKVFREEPIHSGPVAAIAKAIGHVRGEFVAILATDMPFAGKLLPKLYENISIGTDVVIPIDDQNFLQPLCALYSTAGLKKAIAELGSVENKSMRDLLGFLNKKEITLSKDELALLIDIDSPADLLRAIAISKGL